MFENDSSEFNFYSFYGCFIEALKYFTVTEDFYTIFSFHKHRSLIKLAKSLLSQETLLISNLLTLMYTSFGFKYIT